MATLSPSPNSSPSAVPPTSTSPPPQLSNLSPPPKSSPSTQPNDDPPESSTPPPLPPPPPPSASQPANSVTPPPAKPPAVASATPNPPSAPPPAPTTSSPPPPPVTITPPPSINASPPPPPKSDPPVSSPPPTRPPSPSSSVNTTTSPPPAPSITPTTISPPPPPPPSSPPVTSPTPPSSTPPKSSPPPPPPPSSEPPASSPPPPPPSEPPASSNPLPASKPPESSPPPPVSSPPKKSPSPPDAKPPSTAPSPPSGSAPPSDLPAASPPPVASETPAPLDPVSPSVSLSPPQTPVPSTGSAARNGSSSPYVPQTTKSSGNGGLGTSGVVAIGVIVGVVMLGLVGIAAWWVWKRKKRTSGPHGGYILPSSLGSSPRSDIKLMVTEYKAPLAGGGYGSDSPTDRGGLGHSRSWFTYQELVEATDGFSEENLLGEGGFGCVYKGCLVDGREVAVKQLKIGGGQGEREFKAEVEIISRIHHRHLVSLVGYCIFESRRLLVYEYFPNDTLHFHLHGKDRPVMDWAKRVKIAAGAARGMAYLHEDCHPRIIHRDIKSSNILLDNNFEARVSDFGLAKLALDAETHVSTRVMGTFGYLAPEYATTGKLTEKSDVYSFGVVLLELITGRRPVDESQPVGDESLVEWARPLLSHALETGEVGGLVDPRLEKNYVESEMYRMVEAAAACVRYSAGKRPRMGQVVRALDGISNSDDLSNGMRVGESQMYNSAQSEEIRLFQRMAFGSQNYSTDFFTQASYSAGFPTRARQNAELSTQHSQSVNHSSHHSQRDDHLSPDGENAGFSSHRSLNR